MFYSYILVILMLTTGVHADAQSRYRFRTLTSEDGLTSDVVWSICKDKFGYIWLATQNGLNRYDGHDIRQYFNDKNDSSSLPGNVVYWVHKDVDGNLWFSFGGKGVARYNYATDKFERFHPFDSIVKKKNYPVKMWRIGNDQQGRIYLGNGSSCFRYSLRTRQMEDLTPLFKGALQGHDLGMFVPEGKNILWITSNAGLFRYDLVSNLIENFPFDVKKFGFGDANMHDAEFINDHEMLVAVHRAGFVLFDTRTRTFRLPPSPIDPTHSKLYSETGGVLKDSEGRIWLANSRYGLLEYFPATNSVYSLKNEYGHPYPHPEQEGSGLNVYEDDEGNIWYGSVAKGVMWFNPKLDFVQTFQRDFSKTQTLPHNYVSCFLPSQNGKMFIGTALGLTEFDRSSNNYHNFPVAYNETDVFPNGNIRGMIATGDSLFITTAHGFSIYNTRTKKFSRFIEHHDWFDSSFRYGQWLLHRIHNKIFISGEGFAFFNLTTNRYEYTLASPKHPFSQLKSVNATMLDEESGLLWLEAGKGSLYSFDWRQNNLKRHSFTTDSVEMIDAIKKDADGKLWLGTYQGLYRYDPSTGQGKKIDVNTTEKAIYNVVIQGDRFIWLTTAKELVKYDRIKNSMEILQVNSFFSNSMIVKRAMLIDKEDMLWLGTSKGFAIIDTKRFRAKANYKEPQLVNFWVFDKLKQFGKPLAELDRINLKYNENFFSFSFSAFNYQTAANYGFLLEGFDKDWQTVNSNTGSYTNVPPGNYRLRIRSNNELGQWIERSAPVIIHVQAPFWQRTWFIILLIILTALLLAFIYRVWRIRKQKKQINNTIEYFTNSFYGANSITEICGDIARNCISQLKLEDCAIYLLEDDTERLVQKAVQGQNYARDQDIISQVEIKIGEGIAGKAAVAGKPILIRDASKEAGQNGPGRGSALAVPIIHEGKIIGIIDASHSKKQFFTNEHVKAFTTIAAISANKIAEAKAEEAAKLSEIKLLEIQKLLAETQLMALRAQMNPHFVFNCLNSIQECIVTEKYGEASLYLNKFSKLFRLVLNNSSKIMITLTEEIEVLELYLTLEHMRFEKSFEYKIKMAEDLETDEILIPSMLLQPFVENALWHGLMHKPSERILLICFEKLNDDVFQCTVEDNGIGRKKALELKEEQSKTKRHVSKGMSICEDRIELLQKQGQHAILNIIDKYNDAGEATGTKVLIELSAYLT